MDQLVTAIRERTLLRGEESSHTSAQGTAIRVTRTTNTVVTRSSATASGRAACVGASDTPVDPLQLVWLISRDRNDFVNF